jgi:integrase
MIGRMVTPLYIPPSKKWKGLTVFCYRCKTNVTDICKDTGKELLRCPFGEKHAFKVYVHVPGTRNDRRARKLNTRDVKEAIKQAIDFEKEVKATLNPPGIKPEEGKLVGAGNNSPVPQLLVHALARYVGWLHNENVPTFLQRERSEDYVKDIERKLKMLVKSLKEKGYDISIFKIDDINNKVVGDVYDYLKNEANFSARTFNKHFSYFTAFLKWFSEEYYPVKSWFEKVPREHPNSKPQSITEEEYEALLGIITPENGIQRYEKGVKPERNFYRPYLKHAFRLALETGRRREEIINLKYRDVYQTKGYIRSEDLKVNHIQKRKREEDKKYNYIPLTESLSELLNELGYEKYKGSDQYLLAPDVKSKRNKVMADLLSRSFTHYYKQLNTGRDLTFKCFRKTYLTNLWLFMGGNAKAISGHSTDEIIERHYLDKEAVARVASDFNVFSKEVKRKSVLNNIRTETMQKSKENILEK